MTEARKVEAAGRRVRYLNIGDPITFGFETPQHLIEAVDRAIRAGQNGYAPSVGILAAREAVAAECDRRGMPVSPDRVVITSGTSEGIELALTALAEAGDEVLIPVPTYPLYTAVLAKIGARAVFYRTDPDRGWMPDLDHVRSLVTPATRALVVIDPNNPTGATYPVEIRRALVELADRHNFPLLADEVYADLAFDGPVPAIAAGYPDAPVISFSSLSKAYLAPGWRAGWMAVSNTPRLDDALGAIKKLADGRLCATGPMEHAIAAALNGDRSHQVAFRAALRLRAELTTKRLNAIEGITVVAPTAAFYVMPRVTPAAGQDRRGLRPRTAARDRRPLRLRLGVRHAAGRRVLPHRLPGLSRGAVEHLRRHRRVHPNVSAQRLRRAQGSGLKAQANLRVKGRRFCLSLEP